MPELFWKKNCLAMEQNSGTPTQRVAEAIWEVHFDDQGGSWPDASDDQKDNYLRMAQAAIDALELSEERRREEVDTGRWGTEMRLVGPWREADRG